VGISGDVILGRSLQTGIVNLTDGATININALDGELFKVTLGGNRTIANPTNPRTGKKILLALTQDISGGRTVTWGSDFRFTTPIPSPTLSTTPAATDYVGFLYNSTAAKWDCLAYSSATASSLSNLNGPATISNPSVSGAQLTLNVSDVATSILAFSVGASGAAYQLRATATDFSIKDVNANSTIIQYDIGTQSVSLNNNILTKLNNNTITTAATSATLDTTVHSGSIIVFTSSSSITVIVPNSLRVGFSCMLVQAGSGVITVSAGSGATVSNRQSLTSTAGQYATASLLCIANSGGSSASVLLAGDLA